MAVAEAALRAARVRSSATAAMAATRAAPTAIKAICQPAMPPLTVTMLMAGAGTAGPPGGIGIMTGAAEALAAVSRLAHVIAARATASRPSRAAACRVAVCSGVPRGDEVRT